MGQAKNLSQKVLETAGGIFNQKGEKTGFLLNQYQEQRKNIRLETQENPYELPEISKVDNGKSRLLKIFDPEVPRRAKWESET